MTKFVSHAVTEGAQSRVLSNSSWFPAECQTSADCSTQQQESGSEIVKRGGAVGNGTPSPAPRITIRATARRPDVVRYGEYWWEVGYSGHPRRGFEWRSHEDLREEFQAWIQLLRLKV